MLFLLVVIGLAAAIVLSALGSSTGESTRQRATEQALISAKQALIAYAASVYPAGNNRPGDLPCPDTDNDGRKESSCGSASGSNQASRLGRLPWRSLGIPELRDADGERLWYAVSNNFKESTRRLPLNSDTTGTIQVVDAQGNIIPNVIAVVIAPGAPLQRLGDAAAQDRTGAGQNNPDSYLDKSATEDNADFVDGAANGFVSGIVRDAQGRIIVNDTILPITYQDLMPLLEKQVASTVMNCLTAYAAYDDGVSNNLGRYPWPASMATSASGNYDDTPGVLFGRIPDQMCASGGDGPSEIACSPIVGTNPLMLSSWGSLAACTLTDNWFRDNWREQVFYAIADAYKPGTGTPTCGTCLTVGSTPSISLAVFVARQTIALQNRTNKAIIANYLEGENASPNDGIHEASPTSISFNDLVVFK
nr:type II secretion system protein [Dechloromonas sp.]